MVVGPFALAVLAFWLLHALDALRGGRSVQVLSDQPPVAPESAPPVSVVVAARNEGDKVARGVGSLLALDYPHLEVVAVDDRSTDATGAILNEMAAADPRLRVRHVSRLPRGWLGKNRALAIGAEAASGQWLLFVDADVVVEPTSLLRAVGYAETHGLDHLTVLPSVLARSLALKLFTSYVAFLLAGTSPPWRVRDPHRREFIGIGAFNLVRRTAYRHSGGHAAIRLRPDDDMRLAERLKRYRGRSDVVVGRGFVTVEWQPTVAAAVTALEKTAFATIDYRVSVIAAGLVAVVLCGLVPIAGAAGVGGWPRWAFALAAVTSMVLFARAGRAVTDLPPAAALALPVMHLVWIYAFVRGTANVLRRGGIVWRDTFYSLELLRSAVHHRDPLR